MSTLLDRDPRGKFIGYGGAVVVWLPRMLDASSLDVMLKTAQRWCDSRAANNYRAAADDLLEDGNEDYANYCTRLAAKWLKRKAILEQARKDIAAI